MRYASLAKCKVTFHSNRCSFLKACCSALSELQGGSWRLCLNFAWRLSLKHANELKIKVGMLYDCSEQWLLIMVCIKQSKVYFCWLSAIIYHFELSCIKSVPFVTATSYKDSCSIWIILELNSVLQLIGASNKVHKISNKIILVFRFQLCLSSVNVKWPEFSTHISKWIQLQNSDLEKKSRVSSHREIVTFQFY